MYSLKVTISLHPGVSGTNPQQAAGKFNAIMALTISDPETGFKA